MWNVDRISHTCECDCVCTCKFFYCAYQWSLFAQRALLPDMSERSVLNLHVLDAHTCLSALSAIAHFALHCAMQQHTLQHPMNTQSSVSIERPSDSANHTFCISAYSRGTPYLPCMLTYPILSPYTCRICAHNTKSTITRSELSGACLGPTETKLRASQIGSTAQIDARSFKSLHTTQSAQRGPAHVPLSLWCTFCYFLLWRADDHWQFVLSASYLALASTPHCNWNCLYKSCQGMCSVTNANGNSQGKQQKSEMGTSRYKIMYVDEVFASNASDGTRKEADKKRVYPAKPHQQLQATGRLWIKLALFPVINFLSFLEMLRAVQLFSPSRKQPRSG